MAKSGKTGKDRIQVEGNESALGDALGMAIGSQVMAGIMSGGKQIISTHQERGLLVFYFSDKTTMVISGDFEVSYGTHNEEIPGGQTPEDFIEGEAAEELDNPQLEHPK
jgi:hypothetical protein